MLNLALINILALIPVLIIGNLLFGRTSLSVIWVDFLGFMLFTALYYLLRRGWVSLASFGLIAIGLAGTTACIISLGTVRVPATAMYLLLVIMAGLLFDRQGIIVTTAISSMLVGGLILAGNMGLLPTPDYSTTVTQWIGYTAIFSWSGYLTFFALQSVHKALDRADKELIERKMAQAELAKYRDHLEELVKESTVELEAKNAILSEEAAERMLAESRLSKSQAFQKAIFDSAPDLIWSVDSKHFGIQFWNHAFEDYFYEEREMRIKPGDRPEELFPDGGEFITLWHKMYRQLLTNGPYSIEYEMFAGTRVLELNFNAVRENGEVIGISVFGRDITKRRRAEDLLIASQNKFSAAFQISPDPIAITDIDSGEIIDVNQAFETWSGFSRAELLGYTSVELNLWVDPMGRERMLQLLRSQGEVDDLAVRMRAKDGEVHDILFSARFIDILGHRYVFSRASDVTDQKRIENSLKESKNYLDKIINSIGDPIFVKDRQHRIALANDAACKLFGRPREEILGKTAYDLFPSKEMADISWEKDEEVFSKGVEIVNEETNTYAPGATLTVLVKKTLYTDNEGNQFLVGVTRDITERKQAEDKIRSSLIEKEVLLKEIHHRVKNNLQVISSLLSIQGSYLWDNDAKRALMESQSRVKSMALIHENLYRSENLARIDFALYTRDLVEALFRSYKMDKRRVGLNLNLEEVCLDIDKAIPSGLVLNELVTNCLKHAFPGGRAGEIVIDLLSMGDTIVLAVRDNGVGLPDEFDLKNTTSMGLKIVSMLTKQLKGTLEVDLSKGTEFKITFTRR